MRMNPFENILKSTERRLNEQLFFNIEGWRSTNIIWSVMKFNCYTKIDIFPLFFQSRIYDVSEKNGGVMITNHVSSDCIIMYNVLYHNAHWRNNPLHTMF